MTIFIRRFRDWWQPPRKAGDRLAHRQVTFLELFYDLVYVVIIAELSHALAGHLSWRGVGEFVFLFLIVWWAWFNGTTYHDLHGNNDVRTRVFTFLQMLSVVAMAIFAHDALGETSVGFALSYAAFQLILTYMWWRTGVYDENHRPLSQPYSIAFLVNTLLFAASAFVPVPLRFYLWGAATLVSLLLPLNTFLTARGNPAAQAEIDSVLDVTPSLVERFGLFNIIVLGEIIVGVVAGVSEHEHLTWTLGITAGLGTLVAISVWWQYFDAISHRIPRPSLMLVSLWFYLHLPLTMGITATGAAVLNIVEHSGEHVPIAVVRLLTFSLAVFLLSVAGLIPTIQTTDEHQHMHRLGGWAMVLAAVLVVVVGFLPLPITWLLAVEVILLFGPVLVAFYAWLTTLDKLKAE